jgi:acetyl-CoA carboxylase biotin carboxyl carrier protein
MDQEAYGQLEALLRLFQEEELDELVVEEDGLKVNLRRERPQVPKAPATRRKVPPAARARRTGRPGRTVAVRAPLIGTFYRSASPDSPAFVEIGDMVEPEQTVCIVEAMKVFNEIQAEWRGRVVAIPPENGKLVEAGEPLIVLEFVGEQPVEGAGG